MDHQKSCCKRLGKSQNQYNQKIIQEKKEQEKKSEKFQQYMKYFGSRFCQCQCHISLYEKNLKELRITYDRNKKVDEISITILNNSSNFQVVKVGVSFSYFFCELFILNLQQQSKIDTCLPKIGIGSSGSLYFCKIDKMKEFIIKSIQYKNQKQIVKEENNQFTRKMLNNIIFEYCLNKLFSALQIGPALSNQFGFDLIIYKFTVQFAMQFCLPYKANLTNNLFLTLKLMHSLNIIHGDIKPLNIMWSPTYLKNVFIDFGYSMFLKQQLGFKTYTHYFGTLQYSSPEMRKLIQMGMDYVDLYYNDLYGLLSVSSDQIFHFKHEDHDLTCQQTNPNFSNFLLNVKLQKYIFDLDERSVQSFIKLHKIRQILDNTIEIIGLMGSGIKIQKIIDLIEENYSLQENRILQMKKYLNKQFLQNPSHQKPKFKFKTRIEQMLNINQGSINMYMFVFLFFFGEDITLRKKYLKNIEKQTFIKLNPSDPSFWDAFVKYLHNPYVQYNEVLQSFEFIKQKIEIEKWEESKHQNLTLFIKARQIKMTVYQKYNIDIDKQQIQVNKKNGSCNPIQARNIGQMREILKKSKSDKNTLEKFVNILEHLQVNWPGYNLYDNIFQACKILLRRPEQIQDLNFFKMLEQIAKFLKNSGQIQKNNKILQYLENMLEEYLNFGVSSNTFHVIHVHQTINKFISLSCIQTNMKKRKFNFLGKKYKKCFRIRQIIETFFLNEFCVEIINQNEIQNYNFDPKCFQILFKMFSLTNNKRYFFRIMNQELGCLFQLMRQNVPQNFINCMKKIIFQEIKRFIDCNQTQIFSICRFQLFTLLFFLHTDEKKQQILTISKKIIQQQQRQNGFKGTEFDLFMNICEIYGLLSYYEKYFRLKRRIQQIVQNNQKFIPNSNFYSELIHQSYMLRDKDMVLKIGKYYYQNVIKYNRHLLFLEENDRVLFSFSIYFGYLPDKQSKEYFPFLKNIIRFHFFNKRTIQNYHFYRTCLKLIKFYIGTKGISLKKCINEFLNFFKQLRQEQNAIFSTVYANLIVITQVLLSFSYFLNLNTLQKQTVVMLKYISIWISNCNSYFKLLLSSKLPIFLVNFAQRRILLSLPKIKYKSWKLHQLRNKKYFINSDNLKETIIKLKKQQNNQHQSQKYDHYLISKFIKIHQNRQISLRKYSLLSNFIPNIFSCDRDYFYYLNDLNLQNQVWFDIKDPEQTLKYFRKQ